MLLCRWLILRHLLRVSFAADSGQLRTPVFFPTVLVAYFHWESILLHFNLSDLVHSMFILPG